MSQVQTLIPDTVFIERVPHDFARRHLVLGVCADEAMLAAQTMGVAEAQGTAGGDDTNPDETKAEEPKAGAGTSTAGSPRVCLLHAPGISPAVVHNLQLRLGRVATTEVGEPETLARQIDEAYGARANAPQGSAAQRDGVASIELGDPHVRPMDVSDEELSELALRADANLLSLDGKGPVMRLVDTVLFDAIGRSASDIHVQPLGDSTLIRYRIDGVLTTVRAVSPRLAPAIVSRIKVMARMDVAERRAPQDGRATVTIGRGASPRAIDLRISSLPSTFGERVVIRLLDVRGGLSLANIDALHMPDDLRARYLDRATRSSGIVLVTGPTGSGKTTTLYATLRFIIERSFTGRKSADVNVLTIEDPVEYDLSAAAVAGLAMPISQTQVDVKKGVTFAAGLRHILRQDPDVIMVGEIRDAETAKIAIQASLTGHLVFSTLHTNDACGAVARLMDLGAEPFLVASSLSAVLAQRLVRLLHQPCGGQGCPECLSSGYKGRRGLFELLVIDDAVRELINARATASQITQSAIARGLRRLPDEGERLITLGLTSREEVDRVCRGAD